MADVTISNLEFVQANSSLQVPVSDGTATKRTSIASIASLSIPAGGIIMWSGAEVNIPTGWALCNGANGTPDLRNRFVVGAGTGSSYSVGNTGGANTVTLTENQMPAHNHNDTTTDGTNYNCLSKIDGTWTTNAQAIDNVNGYGREPNLVSVGYIQSRGGGAAHENRPPYYALCYIMKT